MNQLNNTYIETLNLLKEKIKVAQIKATLSVNAEMILLYWEIGKTILERQQQAGWGSKIIDTLASDLSKSFPDMKGFSPRNLLHMKRFAENYTNITIVKQVVSLLPWGHNIVLLNKIKDATERLWYIQSTIANGWSRNILTLQIESQLYQRQVSTNKVNNFKKTLPKEQSDLANELLKDPYKFDFLSIGKLAEERELEKELVKHITQFLLELGKGFAFVGQQYHLAIDGDDYYLDMLFYHLRLSCFIVIELKTGDFKPEYAGKLNFYLSAVDDVLKRDQDNPSIGIILCKTKHKIKAEYALRDISKPIGVAEFKLLETIPDNLKTSLPTIEEIEEELGE